MSRAAFAQLLEFWREFGGAVVITGLTIDTLVYIEYLWVNLARSGLRT